MRTKRDLSVNTSRSENLANFREAYPARLAHVSPRWGWIIMALCKLYQVVITAVTGGASIGTQPNILMTFKT